MLAYLPLLTYAGRLGLDAGGLGLDWIATRGITASDLAISSSIVDDVSTRSTPATLDELSHHLERGLIGTASEWWLDLRGLIVLHRGQRRGTTPILSPLARDQGIEASEDLVRRMRAEGLSDADIAGYTARWHTEPVPGMFAGPNLAGEPLGAVGIPTTRLPGLAASYATPDGVTFVLRLPREKAILPNGWQGLVGENEYIILNQIPNENIVQVIPARNLPRFDFDESGNIIIP